MIMEMNITSLEAIAYHLEQGYDNGNISREGLASFLRSIASDVRKCNRDIIALDAAIVQRTNECFVLNTSVKDAVSAFNEIALRSIDIGDVISYTISNGFIASHSPDAAVPDDSL